MKTNAVIRIILWSIVIVVLVGILFSYTGITRSLIRKDVPAATEVPQAVITEGTSPYPIDPEARHYVLEPLNVRSAPTKDAEVVALLGEGAEVTLSRMEEISGLRWGYITKPAQGWVVMDYIQTQYSSHAGPAAAQDALVDGPADSGDIRTVRQQLNVFSAPAEDSQLVGSLEKGAEVIIDKTETIADVSWGYISTPMLGWVQMEYIEAQPALPQETTAAQTPLMDGPGTGYRAYPDKLRKISIEWALGDIFIQTADVEKLEVREVNHNQDKVSDMVINSRAQDKLIIQYSEKASWNMGINIIDTMKKDLYIVLPRDFVLNSLEVKAASATLKVEGMTIREADFEGASGTCDFVNCDIGELDIDTASGDITYRGTLEDLECGSYSASFQGIFENVPRSIEMESMSGTLDITLPENAGFTVNIDAASSKFFSDFGYSQMGKNTYSKGDGACKISMEAASGDVYVRRPAAQASAPETTEVP